MDTMSVCQFYSIRILSFPKKNFFGHCVAGLHSYPHIKMIFALKLCDAFMLSTHTRLMIWWVLQHILRTEIVNMLLKISAHDFYIHRNESIQEYNMPTYTLICTYASIIALSDTKKRRKLRFVLNKFFLVRFRCRIVRFLCIYNVHTYLYIEFKLWNCVAA